jgi:hypothetical protein
MNELKEEHALEAYFPALCAAERLADILLSRRGPREVAHAINEFYRETFGEWMWHPTLRSDFIDELDCVVQRRQCYALAIQGEKTTPRERRILEFDLAAVIEIYLGGKELMK